MEQTGNNAQGYGLHQGVELLLPLGWSRKALGTLISGGTGNAGEQLDSMSFRFFSSVNDSVILSFCWAKSPVWVMGRGAAVLVTGLSASGWGDELWGRGPALHCTWLWLCRGAGMCAACSLAWFLSSVECSVSAQVHLFEAVWQQSCVDGVTLSGMDVAALLPLWFWLTPACQLKMK